jgi:hypothetical protein
MHKAACQILLMKRDLAELMWSVDQPESVRHKFRGTKRLER